VACFRQEEGRTIQDEPIRLEKQRVLVVSYFAKWCHLCKGNIPILNALQAEMKDQVLVVGVDFDENPAEEQLKVVAAYHIEYPLLQGKLAHFEWTPPENIPATYVFSVETHHLYTVLNGSLNLQLLKETVNNALDEAD
jgi:thiol-disulfide isomerase/thioredoxin